MSYRTFKHLLGETSLERKCRFIFSGGILALVTLSFSWYGKKTEQLVIGQNTEAARKLVGPIVKELHSEQWVSGYMQKLLDDLSGDGSLKMGQSGFESHVLDPRAPRNPEKQPRDEFERDALIRFLRRRRTECGKTADAHRGPQALLVPRRHADGTLPALARPQGIPVRPGGPVPAALHELPQLDLSRQQGRNGQGHDPERGGSGDRRRDQAADGADEQADPPEPGHPDLDGPGDGDPGDGRLLDDRPLRDRQAGEAPARRLRRHRGGPADNPQPDPDRRRVRGTLARVQPHAPQPGRHAAGTARGERRPGQEGGRTGPGQPRPVRDEPAQERLPRHHEPRTAHAVELDHRVLGGPLQQRSTEREAKALREQHPDRPARCCWG